MSAIVRELLSLLMLAAPPAVNSVAASTAVPITRDTRLLVIAPHPDDAALAAGGLIARVVKAGGRVRIVWLTSGDGFTTGLEQAEATSTSVPHLTPSDYAMYGEVREYEARAAMSALGLTSECLTFLGFPDEGLCELASTFRSAESASFRSPYTHRVIPPLAEQVIPNVHYRGVDVERELEHVIESEAPTLIVTPHRADEHPDHCSATMFLQQALSRVRSHPRILQYLIHYHRWPSTAATADGAELDPPEGLPPADGHWIRVPLSDGEYTSKRMAVGAFHSQLLAMRQFVSSFVRRSELYFEAPSISPAQCWCNGLNVATAVVPSHPTR